MMFNWPRQIDVTAPAWRANEALEDSNRDGPIALLRALLSLAARYKITLLACLITGMACAFFYAHSLPPTYNATTTLLLEPRRAAASVGENGSQQILDLNRADGELQTIRSERLLSSVFDSLKLRESPELGPQAPGPVQHVRELVASWFETLLPSENSRSDRLSINPSPNLSQDGDIAAFLKFAQRLTARRVGQSFVLEIEYSSSDPTLPARVANATASAYIFQVIAFKEQIARASTEALQGRLDSLAHQVDAAREAMRSGSLPAIPTPDADARVIGAALPPLGPSAPRKSLILALGGVLGLIGGCCLITLRLALDRRVRDGKDLSRELGLPCFGTIPHVPQSKGAPWRISSEQQEKFITAIRDVRTSVEIACSGIRSHGNNIIAVVAFTPNAGASVICKGLAELISRTDKCVTLFANGDNYMATTEEDSGESSTSLADVTFSKLDPEHIHFGDAAGVSFLSIHSRNTNANLFADFANPRVERVIDSARIRGDVILDLHALGLSMDALALASYADAILIIANANHTTIDDVAEAANLLRRSGSAVIGTIICR